MDRGSEQGEAEFKFMVKEEVEVEGKGYCGELFDLIADEPCVGYTGSTIVGGKGFKRGY